MGGRVRTLQPTVIGDELLATVLTSRATHLPTLTAILEINKVGFVENPEARRTQNQKAENCAGCTLSGPAVWGIDANARMAKVRRARPGMMRRLQNERNARREKRRRLNKTEDRSERREPASVVLNVP